MAKSSIHTKKKVAKKASDGASLKVSAKDRALLSDITQWLKSFGYGYALHGNVMKDFKGSGNPRQVLSWLRAFEKNAATRDRMEAPMMAHLKKDVAQAKKIHGDVKKMRKILGAYLTGKKKKDFLS